MRTYDKDGFFATEWKVVGLWNGILSQAVNDVENDSPEDKGWEVSPEAYPNVKDTKSNRADLLVSLLHCKGTFGLYTWGLVENPIIHLEAKGGAPEKTGDKIWPSVRNQIEKWCMLSLGAGGTPCWTIGVIGKEVKFWMYTTTISEQNQTRSRMVPVTWDENGARLRFAWAQPWAARTTADTVPSITYSANGRLG